MWDVCMLSALFVCLSMCCVHGCFVAPLRKLRQRCTQLRRYRTRSPSLRPQSREEGAPRRYSRSPSSRTPCHSCAGRRWQRGCRPGQPSSKAIAPRGDRESLPGTRCQEPNSPHRVALLLRAAEDNAWLSCRCVFCGGVCVRTHPASQRLLRAHVFQKNIFVFKSSTVRKWFSDAPASMFSSGNEETARLLDSSPAALQAPLQTAPSASSSGATNNDVTSPQILNLRQTVLLPDQKPSWTSSTHSPLRVVLTCPPTQRHVFDAELLSRGFR